MGPSRISFLTHARLLQRFLRAHSVHIHALELIGLQPARPNRGVAQMASELELPVISGGDRHCLEPNANVNLTGAGTFDEFVGEIWRERGSRVFFLTQYREAIACRHIEFISQAVGTIPELTGRHGGWIASSRRLTMGKCGFRLCGPTGFRGRFAVSFRQSCVKE
jgi:hypothetical protein